MGVGWMVECDLVAHVAGVAYAEHAVRSGRLRVHDVKVVGEIMTKRILR